VKSAGKEYEGMEVTFNVTEDCNLACKYCYETGKNKKTMKLDDAKKFIDILLTDDKLVDVAGTDREWILGQGLVLSFIGGDALMVPGLVRDIMNYFIWKSNLLEHKWSNRYRISICSNGTLFKNPEVIRFMDDFKDVLSLAVSIDGIPSVHDEYRIFPDGSGTMDTIKGQLHYYKDFCRKSGQTPHVKATLSRKSIPHIHESLVYISDVLGIKSIHMNFIMEDMGIEELDLLMLDEQLSKCHEYLKVHDDVYWSMFDDRNIGHPFNDSNKSQLRCGSGVMPTLGIDGDIYPCFRWLPHTTTQEKKYTLGNITDGVKHDDTFSVASVTDWSMSDDECRACEIQSACPFCLAGSYAEFGEFRRTKYICGVAKVTDKWARIHKGVSE